MVVRRLPVVLVCSLLPVACGDDGSDAATTEAGSSGGSGGQDTAGPATSTGAAATGMPTSDSETGPDATTTGDGADETGDTTGDTTGGTSGGSEDTTGDTTEGSSSTGSGVMLPTDPVCPDCTAGNRVGFHGMALFGHSDHFLAHIPLFNAPHDMQLVAQIEIFDFDENILVDDFGAGEYSLAPTEAFSLDSLGLGVTTEFFADVHDGNFEHGAPVLYPDVVVMVNTVLVGRQLPDDDPIADGLQEHYLVGANDEAYMLNFIRDQRAFQQILSVSEVDGATLTPDIAPRVVTMSASPLASDAGTVQSTVGDIDLSLTIADEIWCLDGPSFFTPC